jgi:ABC-type glycerol-3-phosphate transport system permease component
MAATAAWGFAHWKWRGRDTVLGLLISLMVVPPVVLLIPLFTLGAKLGWISTFRMLILVYIGLMLPFSIYLLTNFFRAIPVSLIEAAEIDGASDFRTFRSVVLPLSGPPLITLTIVNLLWAWNELLLALVFLQSDEKKSLMVGITGFQSRYSLSIPTIMAGMTIATLPLFITYIFGQRYFITGLTAGSVKGE